MTMEERRRALMIQAGGGALFLTVRYEFWTNGAKEYENLYRVSTELPLSKLTGENSEYVIGIEDHCFDTESIPSVVLYVMPRADRKNANAEKVPLRYESDALPESIEADEMVIHLDFPMGYYRISPRLTELDEANPYRRCYYLTQGASTGDYDVLVHCDYTDGGGGVTGNCPAGGDHDFSPEGQPGNSMPDYSCPSCGQTGYMWQQWYVCTKCGEITEKQFCEYCGYSG